MGKGGYVLIDLKETSLIPNGDAVKIPGVYEQLESTRKPAILYHYTLNGVEKSDRVVNFGVKGQNFEGLLGIDSLVNGLNIIVTPDDMVSVVEF